MNAENLFSWIVTLINFGILYFLFNAILIQPMIQAAKEREERARSKIDEAESLYQDALKLKAEYEKLLSSLPTEKEQIARHAEEEGGRIKEYYQEEAVREANWVRQRSGSEAEILRRQATIELQDLASEQSVARARKLLQDCLADGDRRAILANFVERVGTTHAS
ncbi:hypothetical protein DYH09_18210 [bacterium CPR1]|nr:hypothetical protein [bacterium CPR1]